MHTNKRITEARAHAVTHSLVDVYNRSALMSVRLVSEKIEQTSTREREKQFALLYSFDYDCV